MDISTALTELGYKQGPAPFSGKWNDCHWMNIPGTIYCGQTDNCFTGPPVAPNNVYVDGPGYEVIFRQPNTLYELQQVIKAANSDPFDGYSMDGDSHWTIEAVKGWWSRVGELKDYIKRTMKQLVDDTERDHASDLSLDDKLRSVWQTRCVSAELVALDRWLQFLNEEARSEIRCYMFYLETGSYPGNGVQLPDI
jgi:hypothetical protein